ncbi:hypothetical protein J6590_100234 [Homalodisca vitripennis]|nr:hypothetical protein J6590_100234 [Homalodisca vitripennis]
MWLRESTKWFCRILDYLDYCLNPISLSIYLSLTIPHFHPLYPTISLTPFQPSQTSHPCPSAYHHPLPTKPSKFSLPYSPSLPSLSHYLPNPLPALSNLPPMSFSVSPPSPHKPSQFIPPLLSFPLLLSLTNSPPLNHRQTILY